MQSARAYFDYLNHAYVAVHRTKEELFWSTYMATSRDQDAFVRAEGAYKDFIGDPAKLTKTRDELAAVRAAAPGPERDALLHGLGGWLALFEANIIDSPEGRTLMRDIVEAEAGSSKQKRAHEPRHIGDGGESEVASLPMLATNLATNRVEERRKSSFDAFRGIERWVLDHGFLDLVRLRNRFARALGFDNFFDLKLQKNERMTTPALLRLLDDFLRQTDDANARTLADLRARHGDGATAPWNLRFHASGDVVRQMDAYMPFGLALRRWIQSFRRLGIRFRGATMQLDLLERKGKHQNGFCHSPVPAWIDEDGRWVPSAINFTAEAKPDQVGSGLRAINTLFHEGGHAAHFANVVQNSPCFSQEYAPTSMAYAETQSMFCDSLIDDADWLLRYARTPRARRSRRRSSTSASPAASRCAPSTRARLPWSLASSPSSTGCQMTISRRSGCWRSRARRSAACSASKARGRCSRSRTCSIRNPRRRTRATCSPTWRWRRRAHISRKISDS